LTDHCTRVTIDYWPNWFEDMREKKAIFVADEKFDTCIRLGNMLSWEY